MSWDLRDQDRFSKGKALIRKQIVNPHMTSFGRMKIVDSSRNKMVATGISRHI